MVSLGRFIYLFIMCPFGYTTVTGKVEVWSVNQVNHSRSMAVVIAIDRPTFVRNRCVIEVFGGIFVFLCHFMNFLLI